MGQLHELLAVQKDLANKAVAITHETIATFQKKTDHLDGMLKVYQPNEEDGDAIPPESKQIVTTVAKKIAHTMESAIPSIDAEISKEETNASGKISVELKVGDITFGNLSVISLLALEKQLTSLRNLYKSIPTLDPTRIWSQDEKEEKGVYKTEVETKYRTSKIQEPLVLVPATENHPAQVQLVSKDVRVGTYETVYTSGRLTPRQKSDLLSRIDALIVSVKKAKAKANQTEALDIKIGERIFNFINGEIV